MSYATYRSTIDIDVLVDLQPTDVDRLKERFPEPDFFLDEVSARKSVEEGQQFNILHVPSAMKIDVFPPTDPIARSQIERSRLRRVGDVEARISPPEELIVSKLVYYREGGSDKHVNDIAAMLRISSDVIDREHVESLAARRGVLDLWREILQRVGSSSSA